MFGLSELLKDGYKHLSGYQNEAVLQSIDAIKNFAEILRTSFGPHGLNKMVINHLEKLFVTNNAASIIKELDIIHPAAKMLVLASQMQEQECGDGTNLVVLLTGELLAQAETLLEKGLHPSEIINGYVRAGKEAQRALESIAIYRVQDIANVTEVSKYLQSVIAAKVYGYEGILTPIVAEACIQVLPKDKKNFNVDNVRVAKVLGGGVFDTSLVKGHVLVRDTEGTIKHVNNAKVAVYQSGIENAKPETKDTVLITNAQQLINYTKSEENAMEAIIRKIAESGVNVIVSGGAISEIALHFIEQYKLMVVKVLSKFDLRRVCRAVNASALVRLDAPTAEEAGHCDLVTVEEIGSTKVVIFRQQQEESGISTIVVRASTNNILDDVERAIDDGVQVYKGLVRDPRFVPGAGAAEAALSRSLVTLGDSVSGLSQHAIRRAGEAFEVVPRTLSDNAGLRSIEMVAALHSAQQRSPSAGINLEEGKVEETPNVFDLYSVKANAIRLAIETAITVLRVDQIIMSKPAGGPKPPGQGGRDED